MAWRSYGSAEYVSDIINWLSRSRPVTIISLSLTMMIIRRMIKKLYTMMIITRIIRWMIRNCTKLYPHSYLLSRVMYLWRSLCQFVAAFILKGGGRFVSAEWKYEPDLTILFALFLNQSRPWPWHWPQRAELDQSGASIQVTWSSLTNQRPVFWELDQSVASIHYSGEQRRGVWSMGSEGN